MFCTLPEREWNTLFLTEERVIKHAKVVRLDVWERILVQYIEWESLIRHTCEIVSVKKKWIHCHLLRTEQKPKITWWIGLIIWTPKSFDVISQIVRQCTEIWVSDIVFWGSEYSQHRKISEKKMMKLRKISLESIEQSNSRQIPTVRSIWILADVWVHISCYLFDFEWRSLEELIMQKKTTQGSQSKHLVTRSIDCTVPMIYGVVWPEGHFSSNDMDELAPYITQKIMLWNQILKTETAAIVWARWLQELMR